MRVEVLTPADWRAWRDLRLEALQDTPIGYGELYADAALLADDEWRTRAARPGVKAIAYDGDAPVGMAGGFVDAVADWAAPAVLVLEVHEDNERARRAYEKLGFTLTGERRAGAGIDGGDLLGMAR